MSPEPPVTYRQLRDPEERLLAARLSGDDPDETGKPAAQFPGRVVLGAFQGTRLIGATASHLSPDDFSPPRVDQDRVRVTSLAVEAEASGRGIGMGLMRLQRMLAVQRGLRLVTWEQDLLDGRLSHLAIHKLGAVTRRLRGLAAGSDARLDVEWWVSSPRVKSRLGGGRPELDLAHVLEAGAPKLNAGRLDEAGLLHPTGGGSPPTAAAALVEVPHDMGALQARDPELAEEWRAQVAGILSQAFDQGYWLTDYLWLRGERVPRAYCLLIDGERTLG